MRIWIVVLIIILFSSLGMATEEQTSVAVADTYRTYQFYPNPSGGDVSGFVGSGSIISVGSPQDYSYYTTAFLHFTIPSLINKNIISAKLRLFHREDYFGYGGSASEDPRTLKIFRVLYTDDVYGNNMFRDGNQMADLITSEYDTITFPIIDYTPSGVEVEADITNIVKGWVEEGNYGLVISDYNSGSATVYKPGYSNQQKGSSHFTYDNRDNIAILEITYSDVELGPVSYCIKDYSDGDLTPCSTAPYSSNPSWDGRFVIEKDWGAFWISDEEYSGFSIGGKKLIGNEYTSINPVFNIYDEEAWEISIRSCTGYSGCRVWAGTSEFLVRRGPVTTTYNRLAGCDSTSALEIDDCEETTSTTTTTIVEPEIESIELIADTDMLESRGFTEEEIVEYNKKGIFWPDNDVRVAPYDDLMCKVVVKNAIPEMSGNIEFTMEMSDPTAEVYYTYSSKYIEMPEDDMLAIGKFHFKGNVALSYYNSEIKPVCKVKITYNEKTLEATASASYVKNKRNIETYVADYKRSSKSPCKKHDDCPENEYCFTKEGICLLENEVIEKSKSMFISFGTFDNIQDGVNLGPIPRMMSTVPLAVWSRNEEPCFQLEGDVLNDKCMYPLLFVDNSYPVKKESLQNFGDKFKVENIIYQTDDYISMNNEFETFHNSKIPEKFWDEINIVVFAPINDYKSLMIGAQLASHYNAPLLYNDDKIKWKEIFKKGKLSVIVVDLNNKIQEADLKFISKKNVILSLADGWITFDDAGEILHKASVLAYPSLQERHTPRITFSNLKEAYKFFKDAYCKGACMDLINHDKIILINPRDIHDNQAEKTFSGENNKETTKQHTNYREDYSETIDVMTGRKTVKGKQAYFRDSLIAPYLASARDELVIFTEPDAFSWGLEEEHYPNGKIFVDNNKVYSISDANNLEIFSIKADKTIQFEKKIVSYTVGKGFLKGYERRFDNTGKLIAYNNDYFYVFDKIRGSLDKVSSEGTFIDTISLASLLTSEYVGTIGKSGKISISNGYVTIALATKNVKSGDKYSYNIEMLSVKTDFTDSKKDVVKFENRLNPVESIGDMYRIKDYLYISVVEKEAIQTRHTFLYQVNVNTASHEEIHLSGKNKEFLDDKVYNDKGDIEKYFNKEYSKEYRFGVVDGKIIRFKYKKNQNIVFYENYFTYWDHYNKIGFTFDNKRTDAVNLNGMWKDFYIDNKNNIVYVLDDKQNILKFKITADGLETETFESETKLQVKDCYHRTSGTYLFGILGSSRYSGLEDKINERIHEVADFLEKKKEEYYFNGVNGVLTVLASPRAITLSSLIECSEDTESDIRKSADLEYAEVLGDNVRFGRIFTPSILYTTLYVANEIFQDKLKQVDNQNTFMLFSTNAYDFTGAANDMITFGEQMRKINSDVVECSIDEDRYNKKDGETKICNTYLDYKMKNLYSMKGQEADLISFHGHGDYTNLGPLETEDIITTNALIVGESCLGIEYYGSENDGLISTSMISSGATGYYGGVGILMGIVGMTTYDNFLRKELLEEKLLGNAFIDTKNEYSIYYDTVVKEKFPDIVDNYGAFSSLRLLLGDPLAKSSISMDDTTKIDILPPLFTKTFFQEDITVGNVVFEGGIGKETGGFGMYPLPDQVDLITHMDGTSLYAFTISLLGDDITKLGESPKIVSKFEWVIFNDKNKIIDAFQVDKFEPQISETINGKTHQFTLQEGMNFIAGRIVDNAGNFRQINFNIYVIKYKVDGTLRYQKGDCDDGGVLDSGQNCYDGLICLDDPSGNWDETDLCCYQGQKHDGVSCTW